MNRVNPDALNAIADKNRELAIKCITGMHHKLVGKLESSADPDLHDTVVGLAYTLDALGAVGFELT